MPDKWEYPWFAAWDLAFHAVTLAHVDPAFAKYQLLVMCREWFQHPDGALPAYEWSFDDVNPPVHALAAMEVWRIDGEQDTEFLARIFHKLLLNFTWWLNRQDAEGNDLFSGGFLGLDNLSAPRPVAPAGRRPPRAVRRDGLDVRLLPFDARDGPGARLARPGLRRPRDDVPRAGGPDRRSAGQERHVGRGGWLLLRLAAPARRTSVALRIHSMVGLLPMLPVVVVPRRATELGAALGKHFARFLATMGVTDESMRTRGSIVDAPGGEAMILSLLPPVHLERVLREALAEDAFLSPHGLRALSRRHLAEPFKVDIEGYTASIDYEPGESTTNLFGGNSNWRGPVWFPVNYLFMESLLRWDDALGDDFTVEYPTGSGHRMRLRDVAADLAERLVSIWVPDAEGHRPFAGRRRSSGTIRNGETCSSSTSTSTATPGRGSGRRTRPAGPGSWPTCCAGVGRSTGKSRGSARKRG
jgi:hypothetical protein